MHLGAESGAACASGALLLALLAAAAPAAVRAAGEAPAAGGALTVTADPPQLVLGRDPGAELRVAAPPDVAELSLTASVGRIDGVRRLPGGGFTARYHVPPERWPEVAIVAAVGRSGAAVLDGWLAIPLAGQGDAKVRGAPGSDVSVRIGDQSFGPARVGEDGVAVIPVVVPPGVREAHQGFRAVALQVPETSLVHGALERSAIQVHRAEAVRFFAYVIAPHGAARGGEAPRVEVTRGAVALRPREPGAFEGTWTLPPGPVGEERLTLRLDGFPASRTTLRLTAVPGPATAVALSVDRTSLRVESPVEVHVAARALDAAGNAVAAPVELLASAGSLVEENAEPGVARAVLHFGPRSFGLDHLVIRARVPSTGASTEARVALLPYSPMFVELRPDPAFVRADGRSEALLSLELRDEFLNLVDPAAPVRLASTAGPAPRVEPLDRGRFQVRYRPEAVDEPTPARLEARADDARGEARVWLVPAASRQLALLAGGGLETGGGSPGAALLLGAELPAPELWALPPERALAVRAELLATAHARGRTAALLLGPALKGLWPPLRWFASATVGLQAGSADAAGHGARMGAAPALRLALGVAGLARTAPFAELSLLGAGPTPGGRGAALMLTLGVRHDAVRNVE